MRSPGMALMTPAACSRTVGADVVGAGDRRYRDIGNTDAAMKVPQTPQDAGGRLMGRTCAGSPMLRAVCGARRARCRYRIYEALALAGTSGAAIAKQLGIRRASVSKVITGNGHSALVLDALRDAGVPEKYLYDPRRVTVEEVA